MAYKDKDRQRVASAEAMRRYRAKHKGITGELIRSDVIPSDVIPGVIPELPDNMFSETISWARIANLPPGVSKPTVRPTDSEANGPDWWNGPKYAQTINRLLFYNVDELEQMGVFIPCWVHERDKEAA